MKGKKSILLSRILSFALVLTMVLTSAGPGSVAVRAQETAAGTAASENCADQEKMGTAGEKEEMDTAAELSAEETEAVRGTELEEPESWSMVPEETESQGVETEEAGKTESGEAESEENGETESGEAESEEIRETESEEAKETEFQGIETEETGEMESGESEIEETESRGIETEEIGDTESQSTEPEETAEIESMEETEEETAATEELLEEDISGNSLRQTTTEQSTDNMICSLQLSDQDIELSVDKEGKGEGCKLKAYPEPAQDIDESLLKWESLDPTVVTVDEWGYLKPHAAGNTIVIVTLSEMEVWDESGRHLKPLPAPVSAQCSVTVTSEPVWED